MTTVLYRTPFSEEIAALRPLDLVLIRTTDKLPLRTGMVRTVAEKVLTVAFIDNPMHYTVFHRFCKDPVDEGREVEGTRRIVTVCAENWELHGENFLNLTEAE